MSEEEKAPKKVARKRVVKKGVRGTRVPRKKTIIKKEESPTEESGVENEEISSGENEGTHASGASQPVEMVTEIEVVEEPPAKPKNEQAKKGNSRKKESKQGDEKPQQSSDTSEEKSEEESEGKGEGRNRRGRNRRGGNNRDDSGAKGRPIDKDEAAAKAWEIYQGELEEEGVSLVDSRRAREVARRCLELATVFCEERDRYLER